MTDRAKTTSLRLLGLLLLAVALTLMWRPRHDSSAGTKEAVPRAREIVFPIGESVPSITGRRDDPVSIERSNRLFETLRGAAGALAASGDPDRSLVIIEDLRAKLESSDSSSSSLAIRRFIESGEDAPTQLRLIVGDGGNLDGWPTLRVFLLDRLPSVDPEAALDLSCRIMDATASADEYAIALRNLAWSDLDGDLRGDLTGRLNRMFTRAEWVAQADRGLLEAVDAAVVLPGDDGIELALNLNALGTSTGNQPLSRAAMMALDRMIERNPAVLVDWEPAERLQPEQRASLMSRIDPTEAEQFRVFSDYLAGLTPGRELVVFSRLFPNGNQLQGNRLFSASLPPVSIEQRREKDVRILGAIRDLEFPAGSPAAGGLQQIRKRLEASNGAAAGE